MNQKRRSRRRKLKPQLAIQFNRADYGKDRIVYLLEVNKSHRYPRGRSRIVYIGTSRNGASRVAQSLVFKGKPYLEDHGIRELKAYVITVPGKRKVKMWKELESALLLGFVREYGAKPDANKQVPRGKAETIFKYFREKEIVAILRLHE